MIKAIITDLDRTLLTTGKKISDKTVTMFQQAKDTGIKIIYATARPRRSTIEYDWI